MYIRVIYIYIYIIYTYVYTTNGVEYSRIRMSFMLCTKRNLGIREIKVIQSVFNPFGKQETYKNIICFFWDWCYDTCLYSMSFFIVMVETYHGGYYMKRQKRFSTIWVSSMDFIIFEISCRCTQWLIHDKKHPKLKRFFIVAASNQYLFTIFMVQLDVMQILCIVLCTASFV